MIKPEDCPTPSFHATHHYCPSCSYTSGEAPTDPNISRIKELEEELAKLQEALTPSGNTKAAYSAEFSFTIEEACCCHYIHETECPDCQGEGTVSRNVMIPWTNIKDIMKAISDRANNSINPLKDTQEELEDHWAMILFEHSYESGEAPGWWSHSCMSDQEEALKKLLDAGLFETHPQWSALFRPKNKDHWYFLNTRAARESNNINLTAKKAKK